MGLIDATDAELLAEGNAPGFGAFYDRYLIALTSYVTRRVHRPELVFDVVAETFARALEHRAQFDPARGSAAGWLIGIARNLIVDSARRGRIEAASRQRLGMTIVELEDEQLERIAEVGRPDLASALNSIPAGVREAVLRRCVLDEEYTVIAAELRCSEQVARKRVSRGLTAMRTILEARK